ncbi:DUF2470 domain-containing protein [Streptomyces pactum]|uniref:DUF2470 domain-containing protein n=1 Tax=Streptomyces pactum TaxID=68249 RepID=A0ABS0NSF4_9ACTN|nr:DUF2470 domain-containing protein [Streptomyces pactum]MBH5337954.1 DUF2470 domain-containing protein [Streptomyces pactum]
MIRPGIPLPSPGQSAAKGQPRPVEDAPRPTAAERVRTLVDSKATASLTIPGIGGEGDRVDLEPLARAVTPQGDLILLVFGRSVVARAAAHAQDDELPCVMEITDVAPVTVPHRIRARAEIAGWVTPVPPGDEAAHALLAGQHPAGHLPTDGPDVPVPARSLLRLEVGEACVDDLWGAGQVEPDEFAAARPDPLAPHEAELLQHLHAAHGDQVRSLCRLLGERACGTGTAVPLALDRFGLRVRFAGSGLPPFDARFDFPEPVRDVTGLRRAMRALFTTAAE